MTTWAYGVTTVPDRLASGLLERTLKSLSKSGFPKPRLFIDGLPTSVTESVSGLEVTCRNPSIRTYGNFHLGLSELFIRNAHADLYAMFQDDFVTYKNLRKYLEGCRYPKKGYLNLYTFPQNQKNTEGWYLSNQLGKGAVALVFNNEAVQALLNSNYWIGRPASNPGNKDRLWKFIDGGIVEALKKAGFKEYVHNPSLVQHTGDRSSVGNARQEKAPSFRGEEFDALKLLKSNPRVAVKSKKTDRIGLVGYSTASGLGEVNRQLAKYGDLYRWLVKPHSKHEMIQPPEDVDHLSCPNDSKVRDFVRSVDTVLFIETPYYKNLVGVCEQEGKRVVCVPMMEWMPAGAKGWPQGVDLFICPTKYCFDQFAHVVPCVHFPWPVDTERFSYIERTICNQFLFINGHGGWKGRKGSKAVREVLKRWPDIPLVVHDQTRANWSVQTLTPVQENHELYKYGDVLISPHSVDGLGLEAMEAMACGMPVISTDGRPWDEIPAIERVCATVEKKTVKRPVNWYSPDPDTLTSLCKSLLGKTILEDSQKVRKWAESRSWNEQAKEFTELVRRGKPSRSSR